MKADPPWHSQDSQSALQALQTTPEGLTAGEAAKRLQSHGKNFIPPPKPRSAWRRLLAQFNNVLIYVLLVAALASAMLAHWADTGVIIGVVAINALIGFIQEGKAEKALNALRRMLSQRAMVLREGRRTEIPAEDLVPGDIILLQSGDKVPADLRLLHGKNLRVDEAALTGESVPVDKSPAPVAEDAVLAERTSMLFSSTLVTYGQGTGLVVATSTNTEIGRISALLEQVSALETPLLRQISRFGNALTFWITALAALTFLFGVMVREYSGSDMFFAAVGLAVAAIPEGLPAIITITLAIGVRRMACRHAIIRRLPAVETLGSVSVICSDKTGTLTRNEMTVRNVATAERLYDVSGIGYDPHGGFSVDRREIPADEDSLLQELARSALLCNEATLHEEEGRWRLQGDPTEGALVAFGLKAGVGVDFVKEAFPRTDTIPFESEHRFMATLHHDHAGHNFILAKGAPERIFEMCNNQRVGGEDQRLDLGFWHHQVETLASRGQRTLAIASKPADCSACELRFEDVEGGLTLLGIVGLIDPPRDEAIEAVRSCLSAGISVKMITGDHATTAKAIGAQMGIADGSALTGSELDVMNDAGLASQIDHVNIFARTSPEHKLRLVEALQEKGQIVAMTGDGVNDAPALKRADVGVAMGINGTEVAKEAAEMVLADDNFASIAHAVEEGRTVYENIKKAILFILPTNGAEALTIVMAILLGRMLPITPLQILWINMITAVTLALSLAFEPGENNVMKRPPRNPDAPLLSVFLVWRIGFVSLLLVAGTFGLFLWERLDEAPIETARAVAVNALVMFEVAYLFNSRRITESVLNRSGLFGNPYVILAIALVIGFQLLFTYLPAMQTLFSVNAVGADAWARIALVALIIFLAVEAEKFVMRRLGFNH